MKQHIHLIRKPGYWTPLGQVQFAVWSIYKRWCWSFFRHQRPFITSVYIRSTKREWELNVGMRLVIKILMLMPLGRREFRHVSSIVTPEPSLLCLQLISTLFQYFWHLNTFDTIQYHLYRQCRFAVQARKKNLYKCI